MHRLLIAGCLPGVQSDIEQMLHWLFRDESSAVIQVFSCVALGDSICPLEGPKLRRLSVLVPSQHSFGIANHPHPSPLPSRERG